MAQVSELWKDVDSTRLFVGPNDDKVFGCVAESKFNSPTNYHRQNFPVNSEIIEVKNISDQAYLQLATKNGLLGNRGQFSGAHNMITRHRKSPRVAKDFYNLDAPDDAGYQWCQTRGLFVI
ncbi:hypothetical protein BDV26DRAFT_290458 [Aspergillus bertholletiae]|uniref:Uncharacterized protein n=1 Tax=Aspergillus bertholletiae TaxID=1226010 RepID=A0A5N7BF21_9EURO|nr:hypothetical protein BDV26DRAFT_290458 [Aspergillus bertholletiae]